MLTGSVRRDANNVRVIASLLDAAGFQFWSWTFDVEMTGAVAVQERIAVAVAGALKVRLDPASGQPFVRRSNDDPAAHDSLFEGAGLANTRKSGRPRSRASICSSQVIDLDNGYALAYAGLADVYGVLAFNGQVRPDEAIAKARAAAAHALRLDPTLGEADRASGEPGCVRRLELGCGRAGIQARGSA